jgi:UDP-N-acetyl-D-glucosamine dehydrogenase
MSQFTALEEKIKKDEEIIGILGLGYVGLPLAVTFAKKGVSVLGFEKSSGKTKLVNAGENYIGDVEDEDLVEVVEKRPFDGYH